MTKGDFSGNEGKGTSIDQRGEKERKGTPWKEEGGQQIRQRSRQEQKKHRRNHHVPPSPPLPQQTQEREVNEHMDLPPVHSIDLYYYKTPLFLLLLLYSRPIVYLVRTTTSHE